MVRSHHGRRRVRRLRVLGFLAVLAACAAQLPDRMAIAPGPRSGAGALALVRQGLMEPDVHERLRREWHSEPGAHEAAYCATWHVAFDMGGDTVFVVDGVMPAVHGRTTPSSIADLTCPMGTAPIHTHPSGTCTNDTSCVAGGIGAFQCFPSSRDVRMFERNMDMWPLGIVQCGPDHFVFFQPLLALVRPDGTSAKPR